MDVRAQAGASVATDDYLSSRITQSDRRGPCQPAFASPHPNKDWFAPVHP